MSDGGKYADVCPDTLDRLRQRAAQRCSSAKDADKAVKTALHQITGAFITPAELKRARKLMEMSDAETAVRETLALHASTRERLPHIDAFYDELLKGLRVGSVLDLACGLNPLYLGLKGFVVRGVDISGRCVNLVNAWAEKLGWDVRAECRDLLCGGTFEACDLALAMKLMPVLDREEKGAAIRLLNRVPAPLIAVTFPTATLGGRKIGMERHYADWFEPQLRGAFNIVRRDVLFGELVYIIGR